MPSELITVTGATGRQGGALARRLVADGWSVRGLTRNAGSKKAAALRAEGVEVVQGDMADRASLDAAVRGSYGVFSVQNPMISGPEVVQGKNVADAALAAGVSHLVYGSAGPANGSTGVEQWDAKVEIAEHIANLGLPATVLRPMAFMELMSDKAFYPPVTAWHLMPKLVGTDRPLPWVCVDDLAAIAAIAFAKPDEFTGRDIPVAGDRKTLGECRALWTEVKGRKPRAFPMPLSTFERFVGKDLPRMWRWLHDNPVDVDLDATRSIHPGVRTVREWLAAG